MSPSERRKFLEGARAYRADLLTRVRRVACPSCGAKKGAPCVNSRRKMKTECHVVRHREARRAGLVRIRSWSEARKFKEEAKGRGFEKRLSTSCKRMLAS